MIDRIQWLGHGSFRIQGPPLIYINPWRIARSAFHADIVLLSNDQYDHCSPADIDKLRGPHTVVVGNPAAAVALGTPITVLRPWQSINLGPARITAIPAYTFTPHHPISKNELGYIISLDYYDIYYAGPTDVVPELKHVQADLAIVPVALGQGSMSVENAAEFLNTMQPRWVVPSHWGTLSGTQIDVQLLENVLDDQISVVVHESVR